MPPATNEKKAAATKLSPYDAFQATVDAELKEAGCTGYMLVRGVPEGDSEDEGEDEDEERDDATFTAEDVAHVRVVFATARREKAHKTATKLVLGDQYPDSDDEGGGFMTMFNTSFSYEVTNSAEAFLKSLKREKDPGAKFDMLLGFTMALQDHDTWLHDHECGWGSEFGGAKWLKQLATEWKGTMKQDNATLGIEDRTRAGATHILATFKEAVEEMDIAEEEGITFTWQ